MKRWFTAAAVVMFASVSVFADVTVKSSIAIAGGPPGASQAGATEMVMRVKGMKSRTDMNTMGQATVIIADLAARKVYMLNTAAKTVQEINVSDVSASVAAAASGVNASVKPTGQSKTINSMKCDEYALKVTMSMADIAGAQLPPEAAEMMKGVNMAMNGSIWAAKSGPGAAEYMAFSKAAFDANLAGMLGGAAGRSNPGLEKLMSTAMQAQGLPCLTEMDMTVDGTGPMVDMMKQSGAIKTTITTTSVTTEALSADLFTVPADYKVVKQ